MRYLCLCYYDPRKSEALSPDDLEGLTDACKPHYEAWENTGKLVVVPEPQGLSIPVPTINRENRQQGSHLPDVHVFKSPVAGARHDSAQLPATCPEQFS
jgi:hypothetical protein